MKLTLNLFILIILLPTLNFSQGLTITNIDSTIYYGDTILLDINQDGQNDYAILLLQGTYGSARMQCLDTNQTFAGWEFNPGDCYPYKYSVNDTIDSSLDYYYGYLDPIYGIYSMVLGTREFIWGGTSGEFREYDPILTTFVDMYDAFIGIRLTIGSEYHYGMIRLDMAVDYSWCTIQTVAYNPIPNMPAKCGTYTTKNIQSNENLFNIYPNPTTGKVNIEAEGVKSIEVMNIEGKQVYTGEETEIDLSKQPKGIYIIKVTTSKGVAVEKVILE